MSTPAEKSFAAVGAGHLLFPVKVVQLPAAHETCAWITCHSSSLHQVVWVSAPKIPLEEKILSQNRINRTSFLGAVIDREKERIYRKIQFHKGEF